MEQSLVVHQTINGKYRVVIERAASTKGVLGYKVESNGDDILQVANDANILKEKAEGMTLGMMLENTKET